MNRLHWCAVVAFVLAIAVTDGVVHAQHNMIVDCSATDKPKLERALSRALELLRRPHSEWAYHRLFGDERSIRASADDILLRIHDGFQYLSAASEGALETYPNQNFVFACAVRDCGDNDAHIRPGSMRIEICPSFFTGLPFEGRGWNHTQVGTLVHEAAHRFIGGDDHFAETYDEALDLAQSAAYYAMANPDSYAYFIQEDP